MKKLWFLLFLFASPAFGAQYIDSRFIGPEITRDTEIAPTGTANAICVTNINTVAPHFDFCSTIDLTAKTVLYKIPEYTIATLPASHPLAIVTDAANSTTCSTGGGSTKVICWWNGSAWVSIGSGGSGGLGDPGSNGLLVRTALNSTIARQVVSSGGKLTITNPTGVSGNVDINPGADIPLLSGSNTFTGTNQFNDKLITPRKVTPGDTSLVTIGEIYVDGELLKYKSSGGTIYTLFKIGDAVVRSFVVNRAPNASDDSGAGYVQGDIWVDTANAKGCIAISVAAKLAVWSCTGTGSGGNQSLQSVMAVGNIYSGASSPATAMVIGDGTVFQALYSDPAFGPVRECYPDATVCDSAQIIQVGKQFGIYSKDASAYSFRHYPAAASRNLMWPFPTASTRPSKTIYFDAGGINVDGTNCAAPTEQALNSSEKTWAFSCADSNSSIFSGKVRMPKSWDGGTVVFTLSLFHGTTESITFAGDFSAQCRGAGDAINSTYGTAIAADVSITTANQIAEQTTAAVTPNGSCAGGKFLLWRYVVDAANFSTNAANSKVLGVSLIYQVSSLSD